jgi:hypothetical protein
MIMAGAFSRWEKNALAPLSISRSVLSSDCSPAEISCCKGSAASKIPRSAAPSSALFSGSSTTTNTHGWVFEPLGALDPAATTFSSNSLGTGLSCQ